MQIRTKIKMRAELIWGILVICVVSGIWLVNARFCISMEIGLSAAFGILSLLFGFLVLLFSFHIATQSKCPFCKKKFSLGYGEANIVGFVVPKVCPSCGASFNESPNQ